MGVWRENLKRLSADLRKINPKTGDGVVASLQMGTGPQLVGRIPKARRDVIDVSLQKGSMKAMPNNAIWAGEGAPANCRGFGPASWQANASLDHRRRSDSAALAPR